MVKLGVVGLGRGFMLMLPALKANPAVKLTAAFDPREEARERFGAEFGARAHASLGDLLADETVDAVYIASPHGQHAEQTIAAARAGKHVLVEKPMAIEVEDCRAMVDAAAAAGTVLVVGPSHGFDAPVQRAAELIASGRYGAVRMLTALNYTDFMYRPRRPEELDPALGGGVIYSQGAHQIDVVRRIVGQPIASVRAVAGNWDEARFSEGAYTALLTFAGGAAASLIYSGYARYDSDELVGWISELGRKKDPEIYGATRRAISKMTLTDELNAKLARTFGAGDPAAPMLTATHHEHFGFILVSCERGDLKLVPDGIWVYSNESRTFLPIAPPVMPRAEVVAEFVHAIIGKAIAMHDGEWGLATMVACAALIESSHVGREIVIPDLNSEYLEIEP